MRRGLQKVSMAVAIVALFAGLNVVSAFGAGKSETLTGEVGDAMCGNKHQMGGDAAECTRGCVGHGSKYALVVGDKVYTLEASDKAIKDKLNSLAGQKAKVSGTVEGDTVQVASVAASK
jgi:hypothetical protein